MSLNNFLSYLQQLLSMVDLKNRYSVELGKIALSSTISLAVESHKVDAQTERCMIIANRRFEFLAENAKDFAGKPGKYEENEKRRRRLLMTLYPSC